MPLFQYFPSHYEKGMVVQNRQQVFYILCLTCIKNYSLHWQICALAEQQFYTFCLVKEKDDYHFQIILLTLVILLSPQEKVVHSLYGCKNSFPYFLNFGRIMLDSGHAFSKNSATHILKEHKQDSPFFFRIETYMNFSNPFELP